MAAASSDTGSATSGLDAFFADPTFWATVALFAFFALLAWRGVPGLVSKALDERATKIAKELDDARELREEAQKALADAERQQSEAEGEAAKIIEAAKREAKDLTETARKDLAERMERREKLAEQRITRAEAEAQQKVRTAAAEAAGAAAAAIMTDQMAGEGGDTQFAKSLEEVKKALS
ncbi:MAG: ATPase [Pseudomonadota bacterium]